MPIYGAVLYFFDVPCYLRVTLFLTEFTLLFYVIIFNYVYYESTELLGLLYFLMIHAAL